MPRLQETIETRLPVADAFDFIADFGNSEEWDPGTEWSQRLEDAPPKVGSRYLLGVKMGPRVSPMTYEIVELEPNRRVVLEGRGSSVEARDDIRFTPITGGGTRVDYTADLELRGLLRLIQPFAGRAFAAVGDNAREGMQRKLDELAGEKRDAA